MSCTRCARKFYLNLDRLAEIDDMGKTRMRQTHHEIWLDILAEIDDTAQPDVYLRQAIPLSLTSEALHLAVPSAYTRDRIEGRFRADIQRALAARVGEECELTFTIDEPATVPDDAQTHAHEHQENAGIEGQTTPALEETGLNPNYIFDRFVVGSSNRVCHATALAVSENPGGEYNPLFIYGGVGLGKTHLLHAIGNRFSRHRPEKKVLYVTSETFMNEYVESIVNRTSAQGFRTKYRTVDMLLIDDIQFLQRKEGTQEEFFNTFNELHMNSNQIVMSSDRPPDTLETLEERLQSRFGWGMVAEIDRPQYEMRVAILHRKCQDQGLDNLDDEVLSYIAEVVTTNIRELEGTLVRLVAQATILREEVSLSFARRVLNDAAAAAPNTPPQKTITAEGIQKVVAEYFGITITDLLSPKRTKSIVLARQTAMYLCRELTPLSLTSIAEVFRRGNHTTVMNACRQMEKALQTEEELRQIIEVLRVQLR